ncbi:uncharacterized protein N7511_004168 [Penicillium nucicola]|uniref:uncharacterized protein n=1 Tax=Penicillium nucicola TaxID=1850975 RepID=UPI002545AA61|nr:uncharacterized protein N7511_004168 [Penicillium nucicola]KAJ5766552.1 hypothetical protein N7511_004168 [Penicillium nucicola]
MVQTYLSSFHIAKLVSEFEETPHRSRMKDMIASLFYYAFDDHRKWRMNFKSDRKGNGSYMTVMEVDEDGKSLHAIVKIVANDRPIPNDWDLALPFLASAPITDDRCWAFLFQGMTMKLFEYHRDQPKGYRLFGCDFKINGKKTDTLHIRDDCEALNSVLYYIPEEHPRPLSATFLKLQAKAKALKAVLDDLIRDNTPEVQSESEKVSVEDQSVASASADPEFLTPAVKTNTDPQIMPEVDTTQPIAEPIDQSADKPTIDGLVSLPFRPAPSSATTLAPSPAASPPINLVLRAAPSPAIKPAAGPAFNPGAYSSIKSATNPAIKPGTRVQKPGDYSAFKATSQSALKPGAPAFKPTTSPISKPATKLTLKLGPPPIQPGDFSAFKDTAQSTLKPGAPAFEPATTPTSKPVTKLTLKLGPTPVQPGNYSAFKDTAQSTLKPGAPAFEPPASPINKPATKLTLKLGPPPFQPGAYGSLKNRSSKATPPAAKKSTPPKFQPAPKPAVKPAVSPAVNPAMGLNTQPKVDAAATKSPDADLMNLANLSLGAESKTKAPAAPAPSLI